MKLSNGTVNALVGVIDAIATKEDLNLSVKIMLALSKNRKVLVNELEVVEQVRLKLVDQYGEKNENGISEVTPENQKIFNHEYMELMNQDVDITLQEIKLSEFLESTEKLGGIPNMHLLFDYLITDNTEVAPPMEHESPRETPIEPTTPQS